MGLAAFNRARPEKARREAEAPAAAEEREVQEAHPQAGTRFPDGDPQDPLNESTIAELGVFASDHAIDVSPLGNRPRKLQLVGFLRAALTERGFAGDEVPDIESENESEETPEDGDEGEVTDGEGTDHGPAGG